MKPLKKLIAFILIVCFATVSFSAKKTVTIKKYNEKQGFGVVEIEGKLYSIFDQKRSVEILAGLYENRYRVIELEKAKENIETVNKMLQKELAAKRRWRNTFIVGTGTVVVVALLSHLFRK